ncbi:hypothetical protein J4408_03760 [Candidatus Pacearchaeota archaeon]|nr:hypothetical protein [Candidatus Pacearchaeota archaeon]
MGGNKLQAEIPPVVLFRKTSQGLEVHMGEEFVRLLEQQQGQPVVTRDAPPQDFNSGRPYA